MALDLTAIREALAKATPGPWLQTPYDDLGIWRYNGDAAGQTYIPAKPEDAALIVLLRNHAAYLLNRLECAEDLARLCSDTDDTARQYRQAWEASKAQPAQEAPHA